MTAKPVKMTAKPVKMTAKPVRITSRIALQECGAALASHSVPL
jgi:hypothetical protein